MSVKLQIDPDNGQMYEEFGFYWRYCHFQKTGDTKYTWKPKYQKMAEHCFQNKDMRFDDSVWLKFDGKKWTWLSKNALNNFIVETNKENFDPSHLDNFAKAIKSKCHSASFETLDTSGLINVNNGIVNVATRELTPHSSKYLFKYCAPIDFNPEAACPTWENFLMETFQGNIELIDLAQRLFGYIIIGGRPFLHRAFVLYGEGRNGKSTFIDILREIVGRESYSTVSMAKLDKEFSLVNIDGKLANIVEETPSSEINAEIFKTLVGGGEVTAAHKGFDEYTFRCNARFVFACNEMPVFKDKSVGLEERLVFLPFKRYLTESMRDTMIEEKLRNELSGILNWAISGASIINKTRYIPSYESIKQTKEQYRLETNSVYAWFKDEVEIRDNAVQIAINDLYKNYTNYCDISGHEPCNKMNFSKRLRRILTEQCAERNIIYNADERSSGGKHRVVKVLALKRDCDMSQMQLSQNAVTTNF